MAKQSFQKPKGTADLLPGESLKWHYVEETARLLFGDYQYSGVRRFLKALMFLPVLLVIHQTL